MEVEQIELRGDGKLRAYRIEEDSLAKATKTAILECYDYGVRVETPKHKEGMTLGYDGDIIVQVNNPDTEPKIFTPAIYDDARGIMQYILEVTHGIHNHWKKCPEHPEWWGYTYNERFMDQLPFVFQRIKHDWDKKGRISGREYQFTIWRPGEDIILEQEDTPCLQSGRLRFLHNQDGKIVMNYQTEWRSRDLLKAWNENNLGQIGLMKLLRDKVQDLIQTPIELGTYIDHSSSLHLYGLYFDRDGLKAQIELIRTTPFENQSMSLGDYFCCAGESGTPEQLKSLIYAQLLAEKDGHGLNQSKQTLKQLGYDSDAIKYPAEWDSWPSSWDVKPDKSKLSGVPKIKSSQDENHLLLL